MKKNIMNLGINAALHGVVAGSEQRGVEMTNVDKIRYALVGGIDLAKSAGWTRYQKDEVAEAEEALRLFDEMMVEGSDSLPPSTQDVEEFISGSRKRVYDQDGCFLGYAIPEHFLSDWMTDHVRVPVELIENTLEAVREELNKAHNKAYPVCCGRVGSECCGSPEPEWPEHAQATMYNLGPVEKALADLLNASKGE